ncbi:hypothetical protein [Archaeoglobus neptunius]|uniref:hypothetical protein n=1 Tax=Archaeoglobus neptunius TaxID=2798580 RepID=UPI001929013C|nr:hypothetical protein [Archaeoglobus neptunius]
MTVRIRIRNGKIHADFAGYAGDSCEFEARKLLQALSKFEVAAHVRKKARDDETEVSA